MIRGICFIKTFNVLPDNITAALWIQNSNYTLLHELKLGWCIWWKKAQIYQLITVDSMMGWTTVNQRSIVSPWRSKFTIKFPDPLVKQNAIHLACPVTSIAVFETARILCLTSNKSWLIFTQRIGCSYSSNVNFTMLSIRAFFIF